MRPWRSRIEDEIAAIDIKMQRECDWSGRGYLFLRPRGKQTFSFEFSDFKSQKRS
jgi:hypothetical protein